MLRYEEMQYFIAFAQLGTLSEVAAQFHISQPTITRAAFWSHDSGFLQIGGVL